MASEALNANADHWQQWLDWAAARGVVFPADAAFERARARVWEGSEFAALTCARRPEALVTLLDEGTLARRLAPGEVADQLAAAVVGVADEAALHAALRRFRQRQMLRIIWRDLAGWADLDETLEDLTALADACIVAALEHLTRWTEAELGVPRDAAGTRQPLLVIGMGKLGARELNLSSDIDLIFAFPSPGSVTGGPRPLSNEQFFLRLCQRLVTALDCQTADGFVFRVDTRLRPFGDAGPLAMSFDAMEGYYHAQAREWERYAMIKARVVASNPAAAEELTTLLRPFVYRRYLDFGAIDSLRGLKAMIERELKRRGIAENIKLGPGGIREIEFIGQSFQLIRGGRDPDLQVRPIQAVLARLGERGLLAAPAVAELIAAYRFLRRTENRLQAWQDRQTHVLPNTAEARLRLARAMDYPDWPSFKEALDRHRCLVQGHFDAVFADPGPSDSAARAFGAIWGDGADDDLTRAQLAAAGLDDPETACQQLGSFRAAAERRGLSTRASERLGLLLPLLLERVAAGAAPDLTLPRTLRVLEAIIGRTAYLDLLAENHAVLDQLVLLCSKSPWFAERTARHPLLLDELLDPRRLFAPLERADLERELDLLLAAVAPDDLEQQMERLRQFAQSNILRVAAGDVTGNVPLMRVSDFLTAIAEVAIVRSLAIAWRDLVRLYGSPPGTTTAAPGFLVLGYGKLGGLELGYNSDLDLVFIHDECATGSSTDGERPISAEQFYVRLGQRLLHIMSTPTYSGVLYELDLRLRPDGNKGMITRSLASFADYQANSAWTWEHQALLRARPVAGDVGLGERFAAVRTEILCRSREPAALRTEVQQMRQRMRENLDRSRAGQFDLKQGRGGIADIEFMVQYLVLRWAALHPALTAWTDNIRLLATLRERDLLSAAAADDLGGAYQALRTAYHRNALQDNPGLVPDTDLREQRERVQSLWQALIESPANGADPLPAVDSRSPGA
ncbi:MAG: bifunctional [glutamate--ammonia ligase]-adenylyl-L-tyrosine phosphorylase/[glutamate--ammonia-ligase] adenylyltransferase [Chromatiaceae bacterium]|nr:MAG: bifunctional [glutamate--ammonia ligase]-adenylyl-L-tyrosine phosphorylase/[glutamate--ammonia-ligase] adenylyltransferase [Chromatiaceae bacterium]